MSQVYINSFGLVSSLGANLDEAIQQLQTPPVPDVRVLQGLDHSIPFYKIQSTSTSTSAPEASNWYLRCKNLVQQVAAEAGVERRSGGLFLASSSVNVGAMERSECKAGSLPDFLTELGEMLAWEGPVFWINTACTSSLNALLAAQDAITCGLIKDALIIGLELENQLTLAGFAGMQLLSPDSAKPFAKQRNGLVLGEAVAALYLSTQPARWRLAGGAQVIDSGQASGASLDAYKSMLDKTLKQAQMVATHIDLVKVQAAGSQANDAVEAHALADFFGVTPPLITLKTLIGHTLGASGAAEIALLLTLIEQRQWPPLTRAEDIDPALPINFPSEMPAQIRQILVCNLGFGGSHSCIALEDMTT